MNSIENLNLSNNRIGDARAEAISQMQNIKTLILWGNTINK